MSLAFPDLPDPQVTISGVNSGTAGEELQLTCTMTVVDHLTSSTLITVQWSGGSVGSVGITESATTHSGVISTRTLTFTPLLTSHGAEYICQAEISIPSISVVKTGSNRIAVMVKS